PKNIQSWVLAAVAGVMIVVIALTGRNMPRDRERPVQTTAIVDPNAARIQEYQKRIEEQARKLQLEQAELARSERSFGAPSIPAGIPSQSSQLGDYRGAVPLRSVYTEPNPPKDSVQSNKEKREYESLFASNIALSYRKERPGTIVSPNPAAAQQPFPPISDEMLTRILPYYSVPSASPFGLPP